MVGPVWLPSAGEFQNCLGLDVGIRLQIHPSSLDEEDGWRATFLISASLLALRRGQWVLGLGLGEALVRGWCRVKPSLASSLSLPGEVRTNCWNPSWVGEDPLVLSLPGISAFHCQEDWPLRRQVSARGTRPALGAARGFLGSERRCRNETGQACSDMQASGRPGAAGGMDGEAMEGRPSTTVGLHAFVPLFASQR